VDRLTHGEIEKSFEKISHRDKGPVGRVPSKKEIKKEAKTREKRNDLKLGRVKKTFTGMNINQKKQRETFAERGTICWVTKNIGYVRNNAGSEEGGGAKVVRRKKRKPIRKLGRNKLEGLRMLDETEMGKIKSLTTCQQRLPLRRKCVKKETATNRRKGKGLKGGTQDRTGALRDRFPKKGGGDCNRSKGSAQITRRNNSIITQIPPDPAPEYSRHSPSEGS